MAGRPAGGAGSRRHRADPRGRADGLGLVSVLVYLVVLAGVTAGMFLTWQAPKYAGWGTGLAGCALLAAALARLVLPSRHAGLLSSRRKASDVLAFTVLGAGMLALALMLP
ncbi:MAG: DUF3017 domain-containing protein [Streptosporangiaceae bacterium]|nr:DUF3017 domain-containing protein [Streptosporangiaceae bacterium]